MHSTVARHSTRAAFRSALKSMVTELIGTGWHKGMSSEVFLAAWIAAMRATPRTSPFFEVPERTRASVVAFMRITPAAVATRCVSDFAPTSTIFAAPRSSKWVSFCFIIGHVSSSNEPAFLVKLRIAALVSALSLAWHPVVAQTLPDLGDISDATLSETQEKTIGNKFMREVRMDPAYVDDPQIADYINSLGQRLLGALEGPSPRRDIDFFVVREDTINAFAMVGGHIGVNSGLIVLTNNESELAAVVAHEIGHIVQRHQARMAAGMGRSQLTSLAAIAIAILAARAGNNSGQMTEAAIAGSSAMMMQNMLDYTREHEREADRVGIALLQRAGFDPQGAVTVFERMLRANRLNEYKGAPGYLRTHPLTTERIADMQGRATGGVFSMIAADTSFEYRLAKARLRAMNGSPAEALAAMKQL